MKAKDILAMLTNADPEAVLLLSVSDHGYREVSITITTALKERRGTWCEDHGEEMTPEAQYGKRVAALVVE